MDWRRAQQEVAKIEQMVPLNWRMSTGEVASVPFPPFVVGKPIVSGFSGHTPVVDRKISRPIRPTELDDRAPNSYNPLVGAEEVVPAPRERALSVGEEIAARVLREQRKEVTAFLVDCGLGVEIAELEAIENRLHERSNRDRRHAAFSARTLLEAVADKVFPPRVEPWTDVRGKEREVGQENVANRLSAYADQQLTGKVEGAERRAFQGELDAVARWVGGGPHGVHTAAAAELAYSRLMTVLSYVARSYRAH